MVSALQVRTGFLLLGACLCFPAGELRAQNALSARVLAQMSQEQLECLYRGASPGLIPHGYLPGKAIQPSSKTLARTRSKVINLLWHGKHFDGCEGMLVNQWLGCRAVRARVYHGTSWLDGQPSIIMDYRGVSRIWADVRDELREVAPGLYLGLMYQDEQPCPRFKMFFVLEARSGE